MLRAFQAYGRETFSSLRVRNYRLYFIGQVISVTGTFMQAIAQDWLVYSMTHSPTLLGIVAAIQYLPLLVLGPWGGVIADRFPKRRMLIATQTIFGVLALILGLLTLLGWVQLWMVIVLALCFGLTNVVDNPSRQSFIVEMVGKDEVRNAVTLNTSLVNLARVLGPAMAGVLIAGVGMAPCFLLNALSYIAVIVMLLLMRSQGIEMSQPSQHQGGQLQEGFRYVWRTPVLRNALLLMAVLGTMTYEFQVSLPPLAQRVFHGDAGTYAALSAATGLGSVMGGLLTARRHQATVALVASAGLGLGFAVCLAALMPTFILALLALVVAGFFSNQFIALGNSTLQINSDPRLRGRVMSYWAMAFLGSTAVGGPIVGWISAALGPRFGLLAGGVAAVLAGLTFGWQERRKIMRRQG